jgi:molybdopterin synthase catalytic subunit
MPAQIPIQTQIRIQAADFDQGAEYNQLAQGTNAGAVVTFVGRVRDFVGSTDESLWLEHYAGMTEKVLADLVAQARKRWELIGVTIIHRIGQLRPGEQIVLVGVSSAHRHAAFSACEFLMDFLKTQAPFWKREGDQWVQAKDSDQEAADTWNPEKPPLS